MKEYTEKEKAKMRVAVAKDVIKQINTGRYKAKRGVYVSGVKRIKSAVKGLFPKKVADWLSFSFSLCKRGTPADAELAGELGKEFKPIVKDIKSCDVCAKGAFFISTVDKYNRLKVEDLVDIADTSHTLSDPSDTIEWLFDYDQLDEMENAFERFVFIGRRPSASDSLISIAQNIIDNKGTFNATKWRSL